MCFQTHSGAAEKWTPCAAQGVDAELLNQATLAELSGDAAAAQAEAEQERALEPASEPGHILDPLTAHLNSALEKQQAPQSGGAEAAPQPVPSSNGASTLQQ